MPLFCIDRSPHLAALPRSPQRAARFTGIVGAGSMLVLVSMMVTGGNGADGAANAEAGSPAAENLTAVSAVPLVAVTPVVTNAATTTSLTTPACTNNYVVVAGDFWVRIARRASISASELLTANRATSDTPLYPDQVICLPDGATVVVPTTQATAATPPVTTKATTPAITPATAVKPKAAPVATTPSSSSHASA